MAFDQKIYGDYANVAQTAQSLKAVFRQSKNWQQMSITQVESLENLATHLARILVGDAGYLEHWEDMIAHAQFGAKHGLVSMPQVERDLSNVLKAAARVDGNAA